MSTALNALTIPALRGLMGDWRYYLCFMSLEQLSTRVGFAQEVHKSKGLSDMIQRELTEGDYIRECRGFRADHS